MRPIPAKHKQRIDASPRFKVCARRGMNCSGRITIEHAWIYAGKQINEMWAYVPLCWYHHLGAGLDKDMNKWLSLQQATAEDLKKYPRVDWVQQIRYLNRKYGPATSLWCHTTPRQAQVSQ